MNKRKWQYGEFFILLIGFVISIVATCQSYEKAETNKRSADSTAIANSNLQNRILQLQQADDSVQRVINSSNDTIKRLQRTIIELQGDINFTLKGVGFPIIIPRVTQIGSSEFLEIKIKNIHSYPVNEIKVDFLDIYNQTKDRIIEEHVSYTGRETKEEIQASIERKVRGYNRNNTFISLSSGESREIYFEKIVGYFTYVEFSVNVSGKHGATYECKFKLSSSTPNINYTHVMDIYYVVDGIKYTETEFKKKFIKTTTRKETK